LDRPSTSDGETWNRICSVSSNNPFYLSKPSAASDLSWTAVVVDLHVIAGTYPGAMPDLVGGIGIKPARTEGPPKDIQIACETLHHGVRDHRIRVRGVPDFSAKILTNLSIRRKLSGSGSICVAMRIRCSCTPL